PPRYLGSIPLVPRCVPSFKASGLGRVLLFPVPFLVPKCLRGALNDEPCRRGFAVPRLPQRWSPLVGSIILGLLWAAWHLPNYFRPDWSTVNGGVSFSGIAVFAAATVTFSVVLTWVYNHTGGSILMAIVVHASINFS